MKIHTRTLDGGGDNAHTVDVLLGYAKEILGDAWSFTPSEDGKNSRMFFRDPTGSGDHGWQFAAVNSSPYIISNGVFTPSGSWAAVSEKFGLFTGVVWESSGGSVGIGYQDGAGRYITWYMLIKFDGKYLGKDLYGAAVCEHNGRGAIMVHGNVNIATINTCCHGSIGSGIYLHPLYDPVSGLVSADIFGVQSMDSNIFAQNGTIIKQGGVSYMSMRGGKNLGVESLLFVKM